MYTVEGKNCFLWKDIKKSPSIYQPDLFSGSVNEVHQSLIQWSHYVLEIQLFQSASMSAVHLELIIKYSTQGNKTQYTSSMWHRNEALEESIMVLTDTVLIDT